MVQVYKPETIDLGAAIDMLPDGDRIHTYQRGELMLDGVYWNRSKLIAAMRKYKDTLKETGPIAQEMSHGLVMNDGINDIYIATKPKT